MIAEFVTIWDEFKSEIEAKFRDEHPSYSEIVEAVIQMLYDHAEDSDPDPKRITEIDHGEYQGTLLYIIGASGYQPSTYWSVFVGYGSCALCDTLRAISGYSTGKPNKKQVAAYMTLALHVLQGLKRIGEE
jgi:hypothetical protein